MTSDAEKLIETYQSWRDHVPIEERARLKVLEERIERKRRSLDETLAERQEIMERTIERMKAAADNDDQLSDGGR
ncbi:hypothetical protein O2N63_02820 [Aliiroseovarius sp. KMU-50]|uniref:Uncharacterized protein n=1 Tax=Aliiroseovarius salicola TaxID=3009082 RepID=A0ABT4VXP3_9RHOB|nr:hypothetical protein [Aliiroseovarius sp. KMU-50]MDA5093009.1 hypothetical protein [Aliiroseovarius sp. KMU-50]